MEAGATIAAGLGVTAAVLAPNPTWGNPVEARGTAKLLHAGTASRDVTRLADPDAHLFGLCAAYHAALGCRLAVSASQEADRAAGRVPVPEAVWETACDVEDAAAEAVLSVPPTTLHGLAAKASVAQAVAAHMRSPGELLNFDEVYSDTVLADVLALAGRA